MATFLPRSATSSPRNSQINKYWQRVNQFIVPLQDSTNHEQLLACWN